MAMKFGLAFPYNQVQNIAPWARLAEAEGWDGCFLGDAVWCEDPLIGLAAAAVSTSRIRLGTMIIPAPLRRSWQIASESVALDRLSEGRLILGLGTGAVWMGWHAFPDEVTHSQTRAEMLDETIDILTRLYQRQPFDYEGRHYHLKLTELDVNHYPPKPVQQPRIPLWLPGLWPRPHSMQRSLKGDGILLEKLTAAGQPAAVTPADVAEIKAYVAANRGLDTPFDLVMNGQTADLDEAERVEKIRPYQEAGATWWIETLWDATEEEVVAGIRRGPPGR